MLHAPGKGQGSRWNYWDKMSHRVEKKATERCIKGFGKRDSCMLYIKDGCLKA